MIGKRKSSTIREENNKKIQNIRSHFLYNNIDVDFTTMVNIFIELGESVLNLGPHNMTDMANIASIFKKYIENIDEDKIYTILKDYQKIVPDK